MFIHKLHELNQSCRSCCDIDRIGTQESPIAGLDMVPDFATDLIDVEDARTVFYQVRARSIYHFIIWSPLVSRARCTMLLQFDNDGNGVLDFAEFTDYLTGVFEALAHTSAFQVHGASARAMAEGTAAQCFEDADENHDGVVSFNEFKTWFDQPEGVQAVYVDGEDERTSQEAQEIEAFRATSDPPKSKSRTEILERVFAAEEMLLSLKAELAHME